MLRAVLFDVNGTLTDPSAIGAVWARPDLGERVLEHAISTAMVAALLHHVERTFRDHLSAAIDVAAAAASLDPGASAQALDSAASLPARPGAADALATLTDADLRIIALTNSGADGGRATLEACGLLPFIENVWASMAYRRSSLTPTPTPTRCPNSRRSPTGSRWSRPIRGISPARPTAGPRAWPSVFPNPDVQADTLPDLATAILGRHW